MPSAAIRMSRARQNGGSHRWTGGAPSAAILPTVPAIASRPLVRPCPSFAIVSRDPASHIENSAVLPQALSLAKDRSGARPITRTRPEQSPNGTPDRTISFGLDAGGHGGL